MFGKENDGTLHHRERAPDARTPVGFTLRRRVVGADRPWLGDLASAVCRLVDASPGELRQLTG